MKSSNPRSLLSLAAMVVAGLVIGWSRPMLVERFAAQKNASDTLLLPEPERVIVATLGYRAAAADVIFAQTLVGYGLHLKEKRRFEFVANYLDVVTSLDPSFRAPYYYADTLITLQAVASKKADYLAARRILERGLEARPDDTELWLVAGQFLAYVAPPYLQDQELSEAFRRDGARILTRACELVGSNENIPFNCISAASLLDRAGDREASIAFLERVLSVIDEPELRKLALGYLRKMVGEREQQRIAVRRHAFEDAWRDDLAFVTRAKMSIVGPEFDPSQCAGARAQCLTSWRDWARMRDQVEGFEAP